MTAHELIEALKLLPPEMKVLVGDSDEGLIGQPLIVSHRAGVWASDGSPISAKPEILAQLGLTLGEVCIVLELNR